MRVRVDIELDPDSETTRYKVRATAPDGRLIYYTGKYGDVDICDHLFREAVEHLRALGYSPPDHYWIKTYPTRPARN
ncbi:MAG: hypothetical protein F4Y45_05505 [Acidobacteria bacterium]|nr:hypothetical protein [Acidobacteriota bacterium]MYJ04569.1 hypothetical protein [Acidobacteriota bacterium]